MDFLTLGCNQLVIDIPNIQSLSEQEYALARRNGLGASDISIVLGTNPYTKPLDLLLQKRSTVITEEELAIGKKDVVRKGKDLEPLIIEKSAKAFNRVVEKPPHQYKFEEYPFLKINFDGVMFELGKDIPVECKFVSTYGDKYYNRSRAIFTESIGTFKIPEAVGKAYNDRDILSLIEARAANVGIPTYYYVQLQQQIMGLNAPYGYLAAIHDKGWEFCIYKAFKDEAVHSAILTEGYKFWTNKVRRDAND